MTDQADLFAERQPVHRVDTSLAMAEAIHPQMTVKRLAVLACVRRHGPYLVLPLLPPMNVRDGLGGIVDRAMNPINYLIPFAANADAGTTAGALIGITLTDAINQRSLNLETFEGIEQAVIDLYSAVRDGYQQRREAKIKE